MIFEKKKTLLNRKCVFSFSLQILSEIFFILRKIQRHVILNVYGSRKEITSYSYQIFHFLDRFSKCTQVSNLMKIHPIGAELFHADEQTDRHDETK